MISWIIIIIFIVIMLMLAKAGHFRKKTLIFFIIFLVLFFYSTLLIINSKNKLDFSTSEGFMNSMKIYSGWLANGFQNIKNLAASAVKMDWTSTNGSFTKNPANNTIKLTNNPSVK